MLCGSKFSPQRSISPSISHGILWSTTSCLKSQLQSQNHYIHDHLLLSFPPHLPYSSSRLIIYLEIISEMSGETYVPKGQTQQRMRLNLLPSTSCPFCLCAYIVMCDSLWPNEPAAEAPSVHRTFQVRILEELAISSFRDLPSRIEPVSSAYEWILHRVPAGALLIRTIDKFHKILENRKRVNYLSWFHILETWVPHYFD